MRVCKISLHDENVCKISGAELHVLAPQQSQLGLLSGQRSLLVLYLDDGATLDDLREAVTTLEDAERIARRVLGRAHPTTARIEDHLRYARAALRARETAEAP